MQLVVRIDELGRRDARELAERLVDGFSGAGRVETVERLPEATLKDDVLIACALGSGLTGGYRRAGGHRVAQGAEPFEGGFFDHGFGERTAHDAPPFVTKFFSPA